MESHSHTDGSTVVASTPRDIRVLHADHDVPMSTIEWAIDQINPTTGLFVKTLELPEGHPDLISTLYGPTAGDEPVPEEECHYERRGYRPMKSRLVARPPRPTRKLTVIGIVQEDGLVRVFTAYGGPLAPREVGDETLLTQEEKDESASFWKVHALAHFSAL